MDTVALARQIVEDPASALLVLREWFVGVPCKGIAEFMWSLHESLPFSPLLRKSKRGTDADWEAMAKKKDPRDLPVLLGCGNPSKKLLFHKRLALLTAFPVDPRITIYWQIQVQNRNIEDVSLGALPRVDQETPLEVQGVLDRLMPYLRQARQKFEELAVLLAAVGREPDAVEPRLVLIDHMLEKGDNRALYLREWMEYVPNPQENPPQDPYHDAWIDNLPGLMDKIVRFKQGLPYYAGIHLVPGSARRIRDCVWWTTLEELGIENSAGNQELLELLAEGAFPALHTLTSVYASWTLPYRPGIRTISHASFARRMTGHRVLDLSVLPDLETIEGSFESFPELCELARGTTARVLRSTHSLTGASLSAHDLRNVPETVQEVHLMNKHQRLTRGQGGFSHLSWTGEHMGQLAWLLTVLQPIRITDIELHFTSPPDERAQKSVFTLLKDFPQVTPVITGIPNL